MKQTQLFVAVFVLTVPLVTRAHFIADELGVGTSQTTPINPRSGYLYDRLFGSIDLGEAVSLRLDATGTHDFATSAQHGAHFRFVGREIFSFIGGLDWNVSEHFFLSAEGDFSPRSTASADAPVNFASSGQADASINSSSTLYGFLARAGFHVGDNPDTETTIDGDFSLVHYSSRQAVVAVDSGSGPVDIQSVINDCLQNQQAGCDEYISAANQQSVELNQYRTSVSLTQALYDTDLTLAGSYYWYNHDPTTLGYFSLLTAGRSFAANAGVPLAPLRFTVGPGVGHSFGGFRVDLSYQYGQYVADQGRRHGGAIKLQYKFSRVISAWFRVDGVDDLDRQGDTTLSALALIGLRAHF